MTLDEIIDKINSAEEINPLSWEPADRLRYSIVTLGAIHETIEHVMDHLNAREEGREGDEVNDVEREIAFREWDRAMLMGHNIHTLLQSTLDSVVRMRLLKEKTELILGRPVKGVEFVGGVGFLRVEMDEDEMPDDLSGMDGI